MRRISFGQLVGKRGYMEVREQKQLIVSVDLEIFKEAKKRAVERGLTLKAWVVQALLERMAREDRAK